MEPSTGSVHPCARPRTAGFTDPEVEAALRHDVRVGAAAYRAGHVVDHIALEELSEGRLVLPPDEDGPLAIERGGRRELLCQVHQQPVRCPSHQLRIFSIIAQYRLVADPDDLRLGYLQPVLSRLV